MRYLKQVQTMIKQPMMIAVVAAVAAGSAQAENIMQYTPPAGEDQLQNRIVDIQLADNTSSSSSNKSHSDSDMAAKNWDNPAVLDAHAIKPSNPAGMAAETWRSLDQPVIYSDSDMAAKNWDNPAVLDAHAIKPSNPAGMAAETWRSLDQPVIHSDSDMAAKNWNNPAGQDAHAIKPSNSAGMAAKNWKDGK